MNNCRYFLAAVLLSIVVPGYCQPNSPSGQPATHAILKSPPGNIWARRVSRVVLLEDTANKENKKLRNEGEGRPLAELLYTEIMNGKLTAYSTDDSRFTTPLSSLSVKALFAPKQDTILVTDPITGKNMNKVVAEDVDFSAIVKYRVLEEWIYDRSTGKTNIQIVGIAPVKDVYGVNGDYRGRQTLYWLKYNDVQEILANYEQNHPDSNVSLAVWKDYFSENEEK